jgi:hypothetical protein
MGSFSMFFRYFNIQNYVQINKYSKPRFIQSPIIFICGKYLSDIKLSNIIIKSNRNNFHISMK